MVSTVFHPLIYAIEYNTLLSSNKSLDRAGLERQTKLKSGRKKKERAMVSKFSSIDV